MKNIQSKPQPHHPIAAQKVESQLFGADNLKWMVIGLIVMAIGFFLMAGGKSADPNVFNDKIIYSFQRITLAPILIIAGLVIEIYAIMKKPTNKAGE
ncbi:MAG: DUF3098 domain-containing protein [Ginsengibacter sp.]